MNKEDKSLLLQDLCARLPYGVKIKLGDFNYQVCGYNSEKPLPLKIWYYYRNSSKSLIDVYLEDYHPYLRPMSSMTEEEKEEYGKVCELDTEILANHSMNGEPFPALYNSQDWLNKYHFDYRGLIERGLAIEAPKEMYN